MKVRRLSENRTNFEKLDQLTTNLEKLDKNGEKCLYFRTNIIKWQKNGANITVI